MIILCEPSCKSFSHEKINEGFLYKTRLAFPNEKILFFGHKSHIKVLSTNLTDSKIEVSNIQFIKIRINPSPSALGLITNYNILRKIKRFILNNNQTKLFFLSHPKTLLFILKYFNFKINANKIFVQHGELESLLNPITPKFNLLDIPKRSLVSKIRKVNFNTLKNFISKFLVKLDPIYWILKKVPYGEILQKRHNSSFRYILISDHIIKNLSKILNPNKFNFYTVSYPQIQKNIKNFNSSNNEFPKFAVLGYGDSRMLYNLNVNIKKVISKEKFEIRIIGMDNRGIENFAWVTCPKKGKTLTRADIKNYLYDIDYLLILYTEERYRLSCSASIIEAISYGKPIIHLKNDCISYFNDELKIGYEETNIESITKRILSISKNYSSELSNKKFFQKNIKIKRQFNSPKHQLEDFKNIFK